MKKLFRKTIDLINEYLNWIKAIFIAFVLVFVVYEAIHIVTEVNGAQMKAALETQSPISLLILAVLGFVAVLPMLIYDFTITDFLPGKFKISYIIESGWIVNTFTNIAGFGGFLGASLRATFYSKNATKKQVLYAISKIALFLLAGLSTYCIVALVMIFGFGVGSQYSHSLDWVWLVGGGLYFPIIFLFTRLSNLDFFDDLTLTREMKLVIGSCLEWGSCAALFLIIGAFMKLPINLVEVFPIFIVANVIGVVSMLPGGLGTFDTTMIISLGALGVSPSVATVWVLLYRVFYYFLPFFVGCALFIKKMGKKINEYLDDIPKSLIHRTAQIVITLFMYFSGIMMILYATVPNLVLFNGIYQALTPYTLYFLGQLSNIIIGFLLIGLASGVGARLKKAFWPSVILLIFAIVNTLWKEDFPIGVVIFLGFILMCLWLAEPGMYREKMTYSWGKILLNGFIFGSSLVMYLIVGIHAVNQDFPLKFTNSNLLPSQQVWLTGFMGIIISFIILAMLTKYFMYSNINWLKQPFDQKRVKDLIANFGGNEVSHLVFLRDKNVYFYSEDEKDQVMFMYKKKANKLIIMGEPVGNQDKLDSAIDQFMVDADVADYTLVFYEVGEKLTLLLHEKGFDFIKAGEEGHVDLSSFTLAGKRHRGERSLMHKFEREGYQFEVMQPPFSKGTMDKLKAISDEWLNGRDEKGFSLGYFDPYYLNQAPIAVIKDQKDNIVAFANIMPTGNHEMTSIDLMRSSDDAPSGIMDGLFVHLFEYSKSEGYQWFNLGMAPLSNVGESQFSFINEKIAHLIYQYGDSFYSFQGLRSYKSKYVDSWVPKYFVYRKDNSLVFTMLQLLSVVSERPAKQAIEEDI